MRSAQFDHAVIIVPSLAPAVRSFERLGFHVMKGGRTGPVHNALILFGDGTYLELTTNRFSALRPLFRGLHAVGLIPRAAAKRDDMLQRFLPWIGAPAGAIDWCIRVDDLRSTVAALRAKGLEMVDEMPFERRRPDGEVANWLLAGPQDARLPFLIEDLTSVEIRVPWREHSDHPNGVRGIGRIVLPQTVKEAFDRLMRAVLRGSSGASDDQSDALGSTSIGGSPGLDGLRHRFAIELLRSNQSEAQLDPEQTCGVSIKLVE